MENRVEKYKLNAKKAFEFAAGFREVISGKDRTRRIYGSKAGRPSYESNKKTELSSEEQKVFINDAEYAYRYSVKLMNRRLDLEVENDVLRLASTTEQIKYAIEYCNHFGVALPSALHNRILMESAVPQNKDDLRWKDRWKLQRAERKQKKYLEKFQSQKKDFKIILEGLMKNNNLTEANTIKELIESM